jgi:hypothetical protein
MIKYVLSKFTSNWLILLVSKPRIIYCALIQQFNGEWNFKIPPTLIRLLKVYPRINRGLERYQLIDLHLIFLNR